MKLKPIRLKCLSALRFIKGKARIMTMNHMRRTRGGIYEYRCF